LKRRQLLHWGCGLCAGFSLPKISSAYTRPQRITKPALDTEEGGLWAIMEREEVRVRRSPFIIRDAGLQKYLTDVVCKLAGPHCPDVRVYPLRSPEFNAGMAPNGMMMIMSGLMLRVENEDQLVAVIGHELGHYFEKHSLKRMLDIRAKSAAASVFAFMGVVGLFGALAMVGSAAEFSREHEREADQIGVRLMQEAGYDTNLAPAIWKSLSEELMAGSRSQQATSSPFMATHPAIPERIAALEGFARENRTAKQASSSSKEWIQRITSHRLGWLHEELDRAQYDETLNLCTRLLRMDLPQPEVLYTRAEAYRLRGKPADRDSGLADLRAAIALGNEPAETHRSLGQYLRASNLKSEAAAAFENYIQRQPQAKDIDLIKAYIGELKT
jgi:beta-barrel assembly-enhancing protease